MQVVLAAAALTLALAAGVARAQSVVVVKVVLDDTRVGDRAREYATLQGQAHPSSSVYLERRIARKLGERLPMFRFLATADAPTPYGSVLEFRIGTFEVARYPNYPLKMRIVVPGLPNGIGDFTLLPKCDRFSSPPCPENLHTDPWLEKVIDAELYKWNPFGKAFYPFAFTARVTNENGMATVANMSRDVLGATVYTQALYATESDGDEAWFLACKTSGQLGPFVEVTDPDTAERPPCRRGNSSTTATQWERFHLLRYWWPSNSSGSP